MIVVRTQIKEVVKETQAGINNISEDFMARLDERVREMVKEACKRAKENGRKTVMGKDV